MSDAPQDSAHLYLAKVTEQNKRAQEAREKEWAQNAKEQRTASVKPQNGEGSRFLPDINPAARVLPSVPGQRPWGGLQPFEPNGDVLTRLLDLENNTCGVLYSLNNASISATCNTDNTITITLNLPSLPAVC